MYWEEKPQGEENLDLGKVADLCFRIHCPHLPLDHAWALSRAVRQALPWLEEEPLAGIHLIHGAESGNGWYRPEDPETELLHLSRRTRFRLRLPRERMDDARSLSGRTLDINGHPLELGRAEARPLGLHSTLFARHVLGAAAGEEEAFVEQVAGELRRMGVTVRKLLCGRAHVFHTPRGELFTRSVMLAELEKADSLLLQQQGVGDGRLLGLGLFLPHKDIAPVNPDGE